MLARPSDLHRRIAGTLRNQPLRSIYVTMLEFLEDAVESVDPDAFDADGHIAVDRELVAAIAEGPGERLEEALRAHEVSVSFDD